MPKSGDSRSPTGLGVLILRHTEFQYQPPFDPSNVLGIMGKTVEGIHPKPQLSHLIDDPDGFGNIMPDFLWPKATRPAPGRFIGCSPAVTGGMYIAPHGALKKVSSGGAVTQSGAVISGGGFNVNAQPGFGGTVAMAPEMASTMLPVIGEAMNPDERFAAVGYNAPKDDRGVDLFERFPLGTYGIALPATNEERQVNLFLRCDSRLVAVNFDGDYKCGTFVYDLDSDSAYDPKRRARLQSALRVVKMSSGPNVLAFQLSRSGQGDTEGGYFFDGNIIGRGSASNGGCLHVGSVSDRHRIGTDADGNPINPLHLSLGSLFYGNDIYDGPLFFEGDYPEATRFPYRARTHFTFDVNAGNYKWWTEVPIYTPNTDTPPITPTGGPPTTETPGPVHRPEYPTRPQPGGGGQPGTTPDGGGPVAGPIPISPGIPNTPSNGGASGFGPDYPPGHTPAGDAPWNPDGTGGPPPVKDGGGKTPGGADPDNPPPPPPGPGAGGADKGKGKSKDRPAKTPIPGWRWVDGMDPGDWDWVKNPAEKNGGHWEPHPWKTNSGGSIRVGDVPGGKSGVKIDGRGAGTGGVRAVGNIASPLGGDTPTYSQPLGGGLPPAPAPSPRPTEPGGASLTPPAMTNELMLPSIIGRPQSISAFAPDLRYTSIVNPADVTRHDRTAPVTFHQFFYGAQGGAVGSNPLLGKGNYFLYTQRPFSGGKFKNGTGNGGSWIAPPEAGPEDLATLFSPVASRSTTYFGLAPGCYLGFGYPDIAQGGMFTGFRAGSDTSGNLRFSSVNSAGVATTRVTLANAGGATIADWLNVGTTTFASVVGAFAAGLTGGARVTYSPSTGLFRYHNAAGVLDAQISTVSGSATAFQIGGTGINFIVYDDVAAAIFVDSQQRRIGFKVGAPTTDFDFLGNTLMTGTLHVTGKCTFDGLVDPTGLQLTPQVANPGDGNTLWINSGDGKLYRGSTLIG